MTAVTQSNPTMGRMKTAWTYGSVFAATSSATVLGATGVVRWWTVGRALGGITEVATTILSSLVFSVLYVAKAYSGKHSWKHVMATVGGGHLAALVGAVAGLALSAFLVF